MKSLRFFAVILSLIFTVTLLSSCTEKSNPQDFTVTVKSEGGALLEGVDVFVYTNENKDDLVWAGHTDGDGKMSFTGETGKTYTAFIENAPEGYTAEESYTFTEENTEIILDISLFSPEEKTGVLELGGVFCDFTFTDVEDNEQKLSSLLETKKAVVLNFWFHNCGPCKMEFPLLQKAYTEYSDSLEVIAVNPMDGTAESIAEYAKELGLTFPMAVGDDYWTEEMGGRGYPTTVVIDRYGTVGFIHSSAFSSAEEIEKLFDFFTAEDYTQTAIRNLSDINDIN